jgi:hypothetical protein
VVNRSVTGDLPELSAWQKAHRYPFEFSTEASMNLADVQAMSHYDRAHGPLGDGDIYRAHCPALRRINALDSLLRSPLGIPIHSGRDAL